MMAVQPHADAPGINMIRPVDGRFCTAEKLTRLALKVLSWLAFAGTILVGAHVITGAISAWHILSALALHTVSSKVYERAKEIVDLNDPAELAELQKNFCGKNMTQMLERYTLETILEYELCPFELLRCRCCVNLLDRKYFPLPMLKINADKLLQHRIITPEIHRALVADDVAELDRILPKNSVDLDAMFARFDRDRVRA